MMGLPIEFLIELRPIVGMEYRWWMKNVRVLMTGIRIKERSVTHESTFLNVTLRHLFIKFIRYFETTAYMGILVKKSVLK